MEVANVGEMDGDEVVQVYFRHKRSAINRSRQTLCGFRRVFVRRGERVRVEIEVPVNQFRYWDVAKKRYMVEPGAYDILVGAASDDIRATLPLRVLATK
jgi:beta-glucosidase